MMDWDWETINATIDFLRALSCQHGDLTVELDGESKRVDQIALEAQKLLDMCATDADLYQTFYHKAVERNEGVKQALLELISRECHSCKHKNKCIHGNILLTPDHCLVCPVYDKCPCPTCNDETDHWEWIGLKEDDTDGNT